MLNVLTDNCHYQEDKASASKKAIAHAKRYRQKIKPYKEIKLTNSLTDTNPIDIITYLDQNFNYRQTTGLNALVLLALREQTTVGHQHKELGFEDIPEQVIAWCDCLNEDDLTQLATEIANGLWDENIAAVMPMKANKTLPAQAIDDQNQPNLLSDY
jgi:hypothetical protein